MYFDYIFYVDIVINDKKLFTYIYVETGFTYFFLYKLLSLYNIL